MDQHEYSRETIALSDHALAELLLASLTSDGDLDYVHVAICLKEAAARWLASQCGGIRLRYFDYLATSPI